MSDPGIEIILAAIRTALTLFDVLAHARERRAGRRSSAPAEPQVTTTGQGNLDETSTRS